MIKTLEELQRDYILAVLKFFKGNRTKAARPLGITDRALRHKLQKYKTQGFDVQPPPIRRKYGI